jgi:hypothetical protein
MRSSFTAILFSGFLVACAFGQGKAYRVGGSGSVPEAIKFRVDREFCAERSPYIYNDGENHYPPNADDIKAKVLEANTRVTSPIADLNYFGDPGVEIVSATQTSLMSDGSDASRLIVRAFSAGPCPSNTQPQMAGALPAKLLSAQYYVINIVVWKKSSSRQGIYQVQSNEWYVFNTSDGSVVHQTPFRSFHPTLSNDDRIYGSNAVGFLAVHLKPPTATSEEFERLHITYNVSIKQKQAINVQDFLALVGVVVGKPHGVRRPPGVPKKIVGLYGGGLLGPTAKLPDDITFEAHIEFPAQGNEMAAGEKTLFPSSMDLHRGPDKPITDILPSLLPQNKGTIPVGADSGDSTGVGDRRSQAKPNTTCDTTIDPKTQEQAACSFSKTYDDEGLYHWDVSVGVPVQGLNELQYSSTDGNVTSKNVSRLYAYGMFDVYPVATDLKSPPAFGWPHIVVGLPFSGKVFNKPFFGSGGVFNILQIPKIGPAIAKIMPVKFNFYGGVVYNKEFRPATLAVGDAASPGAVAHNLVPHRVWKGQFGIEFSIRDVKDKLTGSK